MCVCPPHFPDGLGVGVNDRPEDAAALLEATRGVEASFNLIMFNTWPGAAFVPSSRERVEAFAAVLREGGRMVHVRFSKVGRRGFSWVGFV